MVASPTILLVNDDPDTSEALKCFLEHEGFPVVIADDGREALDKLRDGLRPCVIVLDVMMPNVDGERVLDELRNRPDFKDVPVLIVTGRADAHHAFDAIVGRENVIPKPFDAAALTQRVADLLHEKGEA